MKSLDDKILVALFGLLRTYQGLETWLASPELPMKVLPVPQKFLSSGLMTEDINHPHPAQHLFLGDLGKSLVPDLCSLAHYLAQP